MLERIGLYFHQAIDQDTSDLADIDLRVAESNLHLLFDPQTASNTGNDSVQLTSSIRHFLQ